MKFFIIQAFLFVASFDAALCCFGAFGVVSEVKPEPAKAPVGYSPYDYVPHDARTVFDQYGEDLYGNGGTQGNKPPPQFGQRAFGGPSDVYVPPELVEAPVDYNRYEYAPFNIRPEFGQYGGELFRKGETPRTQPPLPTTTTPQPCREPREVKRSGYTCGFEVDESGCLWSQDYRTEPNFKIVVDKVGNRITGIYKAAQGKSFLAAPLAPTERVLLEFTGTFKHPLTTVFSFYEATKGIQMSGCCDTIANCPFKSELEVSPEHRKWRGGKFACPVGTQKVIFQCANLEINFGTCGLDNIRLIDESC